MRKKTAQKFTFKNQNNKEGFTLIELLVVIAIIAIIAAVVAILINPLELTKRGRDSNRLTDLANIQQAINVTAEENSTATDIYCAGAAGPCGGSTPVGAAKGISTPPGTRAIDGTGWVKVNLTNAANVLQTPTLPQDPTNNDAGTTKYHYSYCGTTTGSGTYEIATVLESQQQIPKMSTDGGGDNNIYEVGSNLNIIGYTTAPAGGCVY